MAVFNPQGVNLAPFYENIQRAKEKEGEAKAAAAGAKYAPIQAGIDAISKVGNYYLTKQLEKKIEDQDKMVIPEETRKDFIVNQLKVQEGTPEFTKLMELSGKYRGDVPTVFKMVEDTGMAIKEGTAINDYLQSDAFKNLTKEEQGEVKLQLGFPKGREELFQRFGKKSEIKETARAKGTTEEGTLSQDKLKAKYLQEYVEGKLEDLTDENKRKLTIIQEELANPDVKTALGIISKSFAIGGLKPEQIHEATMGIAEALRQSRKFVAPNMVEVQTSDGTIFNILETNLETAKKRDPNLKILRYGTPRTENKK